MLPYEMVTKDLQNMIDIGYLKDAYIHKDKGEIIFKQKEQEPVPPMKEERGREVAMPKKTVNCSGCGASNTVTVGTSVECEYCGTQVSA